MAAPRRIKQNRTATKTIKSNKIKMQTIVVYLQKSSRSDKKFMAIIGGKTVHFGASGYSDFTKHKDPERKHRYDQRHAKREDWTRTGIQTAGFWSKWILWNKTTLAKSVKDVERRFHISIR
jgi:hypothetical protein